MRLFGQFHGEVPTMYHGRTSGSVQLHSWITALGQQSTEAEPGRLGVLRLTYQRSRRPYGHSIRAQDRNSLGDAPPGDGLRLWDDLLAAPQGVAQSRRVGEASPGTTRPPG
jgi:hypothetical protein